VKDNSLPKDREASPLPSSVNISKNNLDSGDLGTLPEESTESARSVAFTCQRNQHGDAAPPEASAEKASIPTPQPPSKGELLTAITKRIIDELGGHDEELRDRVKKCLTEDCQASYEDDFRELIEQWYLGYPEINMLNILDETIKQWQEEQRLEQRPDQKSELYTVISKLIWQFRLALGKKHKSFPPETWEAKAALRTLNEFGGYPLDEKLDRDLIVRAIRRFPDVDLVEQIDRKIIWWQEHPEALKAENKSVRTQLWHWFELEEKYQQKKQDRRE